MAKRGNIMQVREAYYQIKERRDTKQNSKQKLFYFISKSSKLILFYCNFRCRKVKGRNFKSQLAKVRDSKKSELKIKVGFSESQSRKNLTPDKLGHRLYALLKVCSDRDDIVPLKEPSIPSKERSNSATADWNSPDRTQEERRCVSEGTGNHKVHSKLDDNWPSPAQNSQLESCVFDHLLLKW